MADYSAFAIGVARRYAEANMTAAVSITRPGTPVLDEDTGQVTAVVGTGVYVGKARVYSVSGPVLYGLGDESQEYQNTYISIPVAVVLLNDQDEPTVYLPAPRPDDLVLVTAHADPLMVGRYFRVADVEAAGQFPVVRRMSVAGVEATEEWDWAGQPTVPDAWQPPEPEPEPVP